MAEAVGVSEIAAVVFVVIGGGAVDVGVSAMAAIVFVVTVGVPEDERWQ